jgi:hypothetical protein
MGQIKQRYQNRHRNGSGDGPVLFVEEHSRKSFRWKLATKPDKVLKAPVEVPEAVQGVVHLAVP